MDTNPKLVPNTVRAFNVGLRFLYQDTDSEPRPLIVSVWQVLPELYGGEAELIPIEQAVQARLVQEGMRRERIASNAIAAANDSEPTEGRFTRAGRY